MNLDLEEETNQFKSNRQTESERITEEIMVVAELCPIDIQTSMKEKTCKSYNHFQNCKLPQMSCDQSSKLQIFV